MSRCVGGHNGFHVGRTFCDSFLFDRQFVLISRNPSNHGTVWKQSRIDQVGNYCIDQHPTRRRKPEQRTCFDFNFMNSLEVAANNHEHVVPVPPSHLAVFHATIYMSPI